MTFSGCYGGVKHPQTTPVTGVVVYQGQPVEDAQVMFNAEGARPATATTNEQGEFQLTTFDARDGAVIGMHKVAVTKYRKKDPQDDSPYAQRVSVLPAKYAQAKTSPLTADVSKSGDNEFRFELSD